MLSSQGIVESKKKVCGGDSCFSSANHMPPCRGFWVLFDEKSDDLAYFPRCSELYEYPSLLYTSRENTGAPKCSLYDVVVAACLFTDCSVLYVCGLKGIDGVTSG